MSKDANLEAQTGLAEAVNAGDLDRALQYFAEDVVDHDPAPDQGPGREGLRGFFTALATAFPDAQLTPEHVVADDDHVCIAYTLSGTHKGDFHGIASTNRRVEVRGMQIGRFEDGQIVERWGSTDELGLLTQLGKAPAG